MRDNRAAMDAAASKASKQARMHFTAAGDHTHTYIHTCCYNKINVTDKCAVCK